MTSNNYYYSNTGDRNQAVQGNNNRVIQNNQEDTLDKEQLTQAQVSELLAEIEQQVKQSILSETVKQKAIMRLNSAADDIQEKEPDKQTAASNLKKFTATIKEASKTSEEAKKLLKSIKPVLIRLSKWLGVAIALLL